MLRFSFFLLFIFLHVSVIGQKTLLSKAFVSDTQDYFGEIDVVASERNTYCILTESGVYLETTLDGEILVSKEYKNPSTKDYYSPITFAEMIPSKTNGNLLLGWARIDSTKSKPIFVLKTDKNGNTIWNKTLDMPDYYPSAIIQDADSNILITGDSYSKDHSIFLAKLDKKGNQIWVKTYGVPGNNLFIPNLKSLADSSIVLMGTLRQKIRNNWEYAGFIINLSREGDILWSRMVIPSDSRRHVQVHDLVETKNGLYFLITPSYYKGLLHTTKKGDMKWVNFHYTYNTPDYGYYRPIKLNNFDKETFSFITGTCDGGSLSLMDTNGKLIGNHFGRMEGMEVIKPKDKDYIMVGTGPLCGLKTYYETEIVFGEIERGWVYGCASPDEIENVEDSITMDTFIVEMSEFNDSIIGNLTLTSESYSFYVFNRCSYYSSDVEINTLSTKVYPNPASTFLTLEFNYSLLGSLEIYNMLGKNVYSSEVLGLIHTLDVNSLKSGLYIYKLSTDVGEMTGRFIISND